MGNGTSNGASRAVVAKGSWVLKLLVLLAFFTVVALSTTLQVTEIVITESPTGAPT